MMHQFLIARFGESGWMVAAISIVGVIGGLALWLTGAGIWAMSISHIPPPTAVFILFIHQLNSLKFPTMNDFFLLMKHGSNAIMLFL